MSSQYLKIVADIKDKLETIPDIGQVHDYYRWTNNVQDFISLFSYTPAGGSKQIRGWEISRYYFRDKKQGAFLRHHKFRLIGYMGLKDSEETDKTFQVLADLVVEKFRDPASQPPSGAWYYLEEADDTDSPILEAKIEPRMFGNVLCHCAEIELSVAEMRL